MTVLLSDNLLDERNGRPIETASLWVYNSLGVEATLTDALDQPLAQPLTTDEDGGFQYKVEAGVYRHDFWKNSVLIYRDNRVIVGTPAVIEVAVGAFGQNLVAAALQSTALTQLGLDGVRDFSHLDIYDAGTIGQRLKAFVVVEDAPYAAVGDNVANDLAAINAAITAVFDAGGGTVSLSYGKAYKIQGGSLALKMGVRFDLNGSTVKQYTNNIPIFTAPTGVVSQKWAVRYGKLVFNTQQTVADTNGVGILFADGEVSYDWMIDDVEVQYAYDGIKAPATAGSFAFVGTISNFTAFSCVNWAIDMDALTGAYTNITVTNGWALQLAGAGLAGSKGFRFRNGSQLNLVSVFADHITGKALEIDNCTGSIGLFTLEGSSYSKTTAGATILVSIDNSPMSVGSLKFVDLDLTVSGAGEIYMFRPTSAGTDISINVRDFETVGNSYSGANIYEVVPAGPVRIYNEIAKLDRAVNLADFAVLKKIRVWNGNTLISQEGGRYVLHGLTAPPASEAWVVGDRAINPTIARATPVKEWACVVAGTPGTWLPTSWIVSKDTTANRPAAAASLQGVTYLDTTIDADGKFIVCNGAAYVDATGAVV